LSTKEIVKSRRWSRAALCGCLVATASCRSQSRGEKWIIPANYQGWLRLDYAVSGAPPLPLENGAYLVRMPPGGRLETSSAYNGSIDRDEFFVVTARGLQNLVVSQRKMAAGEPAIQEYGVQSIFGFFIVTSATLQKPGTCVFVGTRPEFKANWEDCQKWEVGQSGPPKFERRIVMHEPGDAAKGSRLEDSPKRE
jgi:hypothetical protein